jgi:hypothetical protein
VPQLKFTRDHRGYESTFLVDTVRRRGREQSRVLYWFRTPPQVKVGRAAIDEDAIRALEDAYPGVTFDWTRILEARPPEPEPVGDDPRRRQRPRTGKDREARRDTRPERPAQSRPPAPAPAAAAPPEAPLPEVPVEAVPRAVEESPIPAVPPEMQPPAPEPLDVTGEDPLLDAEADEPPPAPFHASEPSASERILGSEGLLRLRARHAEVCARIAAQVSDPVRQDALRTLAEGLNPDAWVTEAEVRLGLEQFEQVLDQVRREVGPLRRRTRRGGRRNRRRREGQPDGTAPQPDGTTAPASDTGRDEDDGPDADEA